ncbi:uncharacterized protein KY384_005610 [Bacidia gigantensis]|uniref:uncharacterized protein n=1 Tax=Bacidia gigantensis TaxID=2732470 RepID=UPI001D044D90|nr:uncharacterized protein KY384_005610 [Bacidia gigantensis]KAG8530127.1 hypothetical protein KY384_005610 [Bacidia gigantensis]
MAGFLYYVAISDEDVAPGAQMSESDLDEQHLTEQELVEALQEQILDRSSEKSPSPPRASPEAEDLDCSTSEGSLCDEYYPNSPPKEWEKGPMEDRMAEAMGGKIEEKEVEKGRPQKADHGQVSKAKMHSDSKFKR